MFVGIIPGRFSVLPVAVSLLHRCLTAFNDFKEVHEHFLS